MNTKTQEVSKKLASTWWAIHGKLHLQEMGPESTCLSAWQKGAASREDEIALLKSKVKALEAERNQLKSMCDEMAQLDEDAVNGAIRLYREHVQSGEGIKV